MVRYLVEQGADIHAGTEEALRQAAMFGRLDVVRYLAEQGSDANAENGRALGWAAACGHLQTAGYLMSRGAYFGKAGKSEELSQYIKQPEREELSAFALSLREQKEMKELDSAAPAINVRSQSRCIWEKE